MADEDGGPLSFVVGWFRRRRRASVELERTLELAETCREADRLAGRDPEVRANPEARCGWSYLHRPGAEEDDPGTR